jgi:site-specific recombinase XerD
MLANTGVRIAELAAMQSEDFDWDQGLLVVRGKANKERLLSPPMETLNRLHAYLSMFPDPGPIWLGERNPQGPLSGHEVRKIIYEIAERAKIPGVHPHRFGAYYATEFVGRFKDIQALQAVLGHTSIETTQRYSQSTREMRGHAAMRQFGIGA